MLRKATSKFSHNPAVTALKGTNQDLRLLQNLISAEKTVLSTLGRLSVDYAKASEALKAWGLSEGDDLGGILSASALLLNHFSSALSQYAEHGHSIRHQLKIIRARGEGLENLKRTRRHLHRKAQEADRQLRSMDPEHKKFATQTEVLNSLRKEVRQMDSEIKLEEAALNNFKRTSTKIWMGIKFGGLVECSEKAAIAGKFGKCIISEIPEGMAQPGLPRNFGYRRGEVEGCVAEAHRGVNAVVLYSVPFVGFRDMDQYVQRSSESTRPTDAPAACIAPPTETCDNGPSVSDESQPPLTSNNGPSIGDESQPPLTSNDKPSIQDESQPHPASTSDLPPSSENRPLRSISSFVLPDDVLPKTLPSPQQPVVNEGAVSDPVSGSNTVNDPSPPFVPNKRAPGAFRGSVPDPFSFKARPPGAFGRYPVEDLPPKIKDNKEKKRTLSKFLRIIKG